MELNNIILVVEDRLSDAVATKILQHFDIEIVQRVIYEGNSYLQRKHRVTIKQHIKNVVFLC